MPKFFDQHEYDIRFEWGLTGLQYLLPDCRTVVIVDVLSFTSCVDVAVTRGVWVYPYAYRDVSALSYARRVGAELAAPDLNPGVKYWLSPSALMEIPAGSRVVLPSPNGATLSLATGPATTFAGCLRNARAVAEAVSRVGGPVLVVAAGERWPDGTLRPGLEDLLGAGAVIAHLTGRPSPEALQARRAFEQLEPDLETSLLACSSGRELVVGGRVEDVHLSAALNASTTAPVLVDQAYYSTGSAK